MSLVPSSAAYLGAPKPLPFLPYHLLASELSTILQSLVQKDMVKETSKEVSLCAEPTVLPVLRLHAAQVC